MDPLGDFYESLSPYNYAANNPILYIDPDGMHIATRYVDSKGKELLNTKDGSEDVIVISDERLEEFMKVMQHTPKEMQDLPGWNNYWKTEMLGFESIWDMEIYLDGASTQWSRQKLINYRQDPTLKNWSTFLAAEVASQNANPLNHIPAPVNLKPKVKAKIDLPSRTTPNVRTNSWIEFNKEMGAGKFTKEKYGSSQAAAKARSAAYTEWKKRNGY